jgi:hypothetical protein
MVWRWKADADEPSVPEEPSVPKSARQGADRRANVNMVFVLPGEYRSVQVEEPTLAQLSVGAAATVFQKPQEKHYRHLKPLYIKGYVNGKPVNRMLVDSGAAVNIMPYSLCRKIGRSAVDLICTNIVLNDFNSNSSPARGVLNMELTVGKKTITTAFLSLTVRVHTRLC